MQPSYLPNSLLLLCLRGERFAAVVFHLFFSEDPQWVDLELYYKVYYSIKEERIININFNQND